MNKEKNIHPFGFFNRNAWIDQNIPVALMSQMSLQSIANENSFIIRSHQYPFNYYPKKIF